MGESREIRIKLKPGFWRDYQATRARMAADFTSFPNCFTFSMLGGGKTAQSKLFSSRCTPETRGDLHGWALFGTQSARVSRLRMRMHFLTEGGRGHLVLVKMAMSRRKCLSLRPIPAAIQRVAVYETRTVSLYHYSTFIRARITSLSLFLCVCVCSFFVVVVCGGLHERRDDLSAVEDRQEPAESRPPSSECGGH